MYRTSSFSKSHESTSMEMESQNSSADSHLSEKCPNCFRSTYIGPTINCIGCNRWLHFKCAGVTKKDQCVKKADVPFTCPTCNVSASTSSTRSMPKSRKRKMPKTNTNILNMEQNLNLNQFIHLSVNSKTSRCETNRNSEVAQLKSISYELEVGHRQAQAEIQRMKEEICNLKYENKRLKSKHDNKIEEILNLLTSKDKKIEDLKEKYQKTDSEKCQLKTELRREKNHVNELINENKKFSEIYSKLKERLYVAEEEKRSLVLQVENAESGLRIAADKIKVLVHQNDLSSSELNTAKNSYNLLKTEMKSKNVQVNELTLSKNEAHENLDKLEKSLMIQRETNKKLVSKVNKAANDLNDTKIIIEKKEKTINDLIRDNEIANSNWKNRDELFNIKERELEIKHKQDIGIQSKMYENLEAETYALRLYCLDRDERLEKLRSLMDEQVSKAPTKSKN